MVAEQVIQADLTYLDGVFRTGARVALTEDGRIRAAGALPETPTLRLERQAILPGMVNVHSHAFQRALRGRGERFPAGRGSFWSWREAMYALVEGMTESEMHRWCAQAFGEMLSAGITTVGEFHYLHHDAAGRRFALDDVVLDAAREAGIRMVLLYSYYKTGGIGQPLVGGQERFATPSVAEFWAQFDRLSQRLDARTQSLGIAPHSIRAVPPEDLVDLVAEARRRGLVVHMHIEEQPKEIDDCRAAYGVGPLRWCLDKLPLDARFTAIHCTHSEAADLRRMAAQGAHLCACPLTEANLGDGVPDLPAIWSPDAAICLGTDSNARLTFFDDMRWLEYGQRLRHIGRGLLRDPQGDVSTGLFRAATLNGARSLGIAAGTTGAGSAADLFTVDLDHPSLAGWTPETLLDHLIFGCDSAVVHRVCVAGRWVR